MAYDRTILERRSTAMSAAPVNALLVGVAVVSIASSAVLVRYAAASAIALAFWRCFGGALLLAPAGLKSAEGRKALRSHARWVVLAGVALGSHFATWLASLELTSTATSVTLVSTAPIFVIGLRRWQGYPTRQQTIYAVAISLAGIVILAGSDFQSGSPQGALLALIGAATMAAYLVVGDRLRRQLPTSTYAAGVYAVAAITMLTVSIVGGVALVGFDRTTWLAIAGMTLGPQLGGHTVLNYLLGRLSSLLVSMVLLTEPIVASFLTWLIFGEVFGDTVWLGAPLVLLGLALTIRYAQPGATDPQSPVPLGQK